MCSPTGLNSFDEVLRVYRDAKAMLGEILSSCEFIDIESIECAKENLQVSEPAPLRARSGAGDVAAAREAGQNEAGPVDQSSARKALDSVRWEHAFWLQKSEV